MLLLSLGFIKDAARAVKRICKEEFVKVKDSVLTELLGISCLIVTMYALRREGDHDVLHLWCVHRNEFAICPKCGCVSHDIHEEKQRCIRHLDIWKKRTFLHFLARRFKCNQCAKSFTEQLAFVESQRRQSVDFELHIYEDCLFGNRKKVAQKQGLSQSTVKDIFNRWARSRVNKSSQNLTRVLGIDEISLKKRHKQFALILSDIERRCILDVLPIRDKQALEKWIDGLSDQQRQAMRFASIDMWAPYYYAVRNRLPHVQIVVDRFHVMKHLNERITQLRRNIQNNACIDIKQILKGSRWILVKNRSGLSAKEEEILQKILESCPELRVLYLLKEEFRQIFERVDSREKAERFLKAWVVKAEYTGNKFLKKFVKTLENWWGQILNYFYERITNGFVEGLNGAIRNIIRRAFGYRNFQNFKLQVFAEQGFPTNPG